VSPVLLACAKCRATVTEGDLFCEGCGADLTVVEPVPADELPSQAGPRDPAPADAAPPARATVDDAVPAGAVPADAVPAGAVPAGAVPADAVPAGAVPADAVPAEAAADPAPAEAAVGGGPVVRIDAPDLRRTSTRCASCGGDVAQDGYCGQCGTPAPIPRDHWLERPASWVAAVCDRGLRHPHNEDAVAVAAADAPGSFAALVVCDGVSSSTGSDVASLAAVQAAREVLVAAADGVAHPAGVDSSTIAAADPADPDDTTEPGTADHAAAAGAADPGTSDLDAAVTKPDPQAPESDEFDRVASGQTRARAGTLVARIVEAGLAGNAAVVTTAGNPPGPNPPSCTFVTAVLEGRLLVAGWVGDSRAYWLPDDGAGVQLSADDSWAGEAIAAGFSREDAERAPQAHAITRWFGVDAPNPRPHTVRRLLDRAGWVLVCSDGLWNYCSRADELRELVVTTARRTGPDPARLAEELVSWAKQQGGHDNITVALARVQ
jgi:serine/threonine protein phosphatase PrpC